MGHTSRSMEDNGVENDLKFWEFAQETSEKNFKILPRKRSCNTSIKSMTR